MFYEEWGKLEDDINMQISFGIMEALNLGLLLVAMIGVVVAAVGAWLAYRTLKSSHDWKRRQYTMDLLRRWSDNAIEHAKALETAIPRILEQDQRADGSELTRQRATEIYLADAESPDWKLRYHIYELLNYYELVATSYLDGLADDKIIDEAFAQQVLRYHDRLKNFIDVVEERRGQHLWPPIRRFVEQKRSVLVTKRSGTDAIRD